LDNSSEPCTPHPFEKTGKRKNDKARPMLFSEKNTPVFFHRLDSLLKTHENNTITLLIHPGKPVCNLFLVIYTFGLSKIHNHPTWKNLASFIPTISHTTSNTPYSLVITPTRSLTTTQSALIFIARQSDFKEADSKLAAKFSTQFWIHLFRTAHKHHNAKTTIKIRRFIRLYIFITYKIPPKLITDGLRLNLVTNYSPHISIGAVSLCHRAIVSAHTNILGLETTIYTSCRKPETLEHLVDNARKYIDNFNPSIPFDCSCSGKDRHKPASQHPITMPFEMDVNEASILRNLAQPDTLPHNLALLHIANVIISFIEKFRSLRLTNTNIPLLDSFSFSPQNLSHEIRIVHSNTCTSTLSLPAFNICLEICLYHTDITNIDRLVDLFVSCKSTAEHFFPSVFLNLLSTVFPLQQVPDDQKVYLKLTKLFLTNPKTLFFKKTGFLRFLKHNETALAWLIRFNLSINGISTPTSDTILNSFSLAHKVCPVSKAHKIPKLVRKVVAKHPNDVWLKIDHNARQRARICPLRFHQILLEVFFLDKKQYELSRMDPTQTSKFIINKLRSRWLPLSYKNKPHNIAKVFLMVKPDGVRFRVLGSYSGTPHKNLLSYAATALFTMLVFSGLNHLAIFSTAHFKKVISDLDEKLALLSDWRVDFRTLDIRNFYAEVQRRGLEPKLLFIKEKFRRRNRTSFVSVPKSKTDKTLSPHPGQDMTGK
jgi:hypothetical protein